MAGEFTKRVENGQNIWTCVSCSEEIINVAKARAHVCRTTTPPPPPVGQPSTPQFRFENPPPGFWTPNYQSTGQGSSQVQAGAEVDALYRYQQFQAEQSKQMMIFFKNRTKI